MTGLRVGTTGLFGSSLLITVSAGVLLLSGGLCAQPSPSPPTVADVQIVSAEVQRFAKPVLLGPPAAAYDQALVLRLRADRKQVDAFPPSMQPVVYIGREEFRIFQEERNDERGELFLIV